MGVTIDDAQAIAALPRSYERRPEIDPFRALDRTTDGVHQSSAVGHDDDVGGEDVEEALQEALPAEPPPHAIVRRGHEHGGNDMSHVRRFDHVGITVADLDAATQFFVALGLEIEGRTFVEGEFIDTVIGIPGSRTEIAMLRPPDNGTGVELSSFVRPSCVPGSPAAMANEVGLRSVAFEVHDLDAAVDQAASAGYGLVGGIGEYEGSWRMAYVRGPEGIIVALAQPIG